MKNDNKRCFVQWFALALVYCVGAFFAMFAGLPQAIFQADTSHMTSVIAMSFVITALYLGFASFRYSDDTPTVAGADSNLGHVMVYVLTLVGLLGTTLGLIAQNHAMGSLDLSNPASTVSFIPHVLAGVAAALMCTGCGIVGSIGIYLMCANIDYFLDRRP